VATPTGLRRPAQGCRLRLPWVGSVKFHATLEGLRPAPSYATFLKPPPGLQLSTDVNPSSIASGDSANLFEHRMSLVLSSEMKGKGSLNE